MLVGGPHNDSVGKDETISVKAIGAMMSDKAYVHFIKSVENYIQGSGARVN